MSSIPPSNDSLPVGVMTFTVAGSDKKFAIRYEDVQPFLDHGLQRKVDQLSRRQGFALSDDRLREITQTVMQTMRREGNAPNLQPAPATWLDQTRTGRVRSTPPNTQNPYYNYVITAEESRRASQLAAQRIAEIEMMERANPPVTILASISAGDHVNRNGDAISREALEQDRAQIMGDFRLACYAGQLEDEQRRREQQMFYAQMYGAGMSRRPPADTADTNARMLELINQYQSPMPAPEPEPTPKEKAEKRAADTVVMAGVKRKRRVTRLAKPNE